MIKLPCAAGRRCWRWHGDAAAAAAVAAVPAWHMHQQVRHCAPLRHPVLPVSPALLQCTPQILNIRTFVVKFLSAATAVGSGLPVGPEGPMIHMVRLFCCAVSRSCRVFFFWRRLASFRCVLWPVCQRGRSAACRCLPADRRRPERNPPGRRPVLHRAGCRARSWARG